MLFVYLHPRHTTLSRLGNDGYMTHTMYRVDPSGLCENVYLFIIDDCVYEYRHNDNDRKCQLYRLQGENSVQVEFDGKQGPTQQPHKIGMQATRALHVNGNCAYVNINGTVWCISVGAHGWSSFMHMRGLGSQALYDTRNETYFFGIVRNVHKGKPCHRKILHAHILPIVNREIGGNMSWDIKLCDVCAWMLLMIVYNFGDTLIIQFDIRADRIVWKSRSYRQYDTGRMRVHYVTDQTIMVGAKYRHNTQDEDRCNYIVVNMADDSEYELD